MRPAVMEHREALLRLRSTLDAYCDNHVLNEPEYSERRFLRTFVDQGLAGLPGELLPTDKDPSTCPNCGRAAPSTKSPYCGAVCREESSFVRQFRDALREGAIDEDAKQAAMAQVLWHVLGGGYPARRRLVPEKAVVRLFARSKGKCEICGDAATTFDHIETACNRPINLSPVCDRCARTREIGDSGFLASVEVKDQLARLAVRACSTLPLRCCDDAQSWDWREYLRARIL